MRCPALLVASVVLLLPPAAWSIERYVAPSGFDNGNDCADVALPCLTIQHAVDQSLPVDLIRLEDGLYPEVVSIDDDVSIAGADPDRVVVQGAGDASVFTIAAHSTVSISGLSATGGGGNQGGCVSTVGHLTLSNVSIRDCEARHGACIWHGGGQLAMHDSTVRSCRRGEAVYSDRELLITGSVIRDNDRTGLWNRGVAILESSTISGNGCGGLRNDEDATVRGCTLSGNGKDPADVCLAWMYGGILNYGRLTLENTTVSDNEATWNGAGIHSEDVVEIVNSTITGNRSLAQRGGGISCIVPECQLSLRNSIVAGNEALVSPDCVGRIESGGYNLIGDPLGCGISGNTDGNIHGVDAVLGPLEDNGGPTLTHAPLAGSPALEAGDPDGCSDVTGLLPLATDQRGWLRPCGQRCDMGAVEAGDCLYALYESETPADVVQQSNLVAGASSSPIEHEPAGAAALYYKVESGAGSLIIKAFKGGPGLVIEF